MKLRPVSPEPRACKICGAGSPLYGVVDFNRSCEEARGKYLPLSGTPVYYRRCPACGFLFTNDFDDWSQAEFARFVYDDNYAEVDPDYEERRPLGNARMILRMFAEHKARLRVLDFGGGNGVLARSLRGNGFVDVEAYDPFSAGHTHLADRRFDVITCFETFEHITDPIATAATIADRLAEPGIVLFSTLVQPPDFDRRRMSWWYIGPRNGHISLFSRKSLGTMWRGLGFGVASFSGNVHAAFRRVPDFARHLIRVEARSGSSAASRVAAANTL